MPNIHWTDQNDSTTLASSHSNGSDQSYRSKSTAPTEYTECAEYGRRPSLTQRYETCHGRIERRERTYPVEVHDARDRMTPNASVDSVDTYASTTEEELYPDGEEEDEDDDRYYAEYAVPYYAENDVPAYACSPSPEDAVAATPKDFADYFPSKKLLFVRHDDTTVDGNMNLRIDTQVKSRRNEKLNLTLFHLRMHDLRNREFSLRRYCRDSGREVCHSIRKYQKPPSERPTLQRSFSSALAPFRHKTDSRPATSAGLKRSDSGYASVQMFGEDNEVSSAGARARAMKLMPTNTIKLEFSNYAHVDIKRRGAKSGKRYVFEYWDAKYTWKRTIRQDGPTECVSFHLYREGYDKVLAYIIPMMMNPAQRHEELARGGWIPPCHLRLCDKSIINAAPDVSDIVVSSGLIALVDDCIKRHFHPKQTVQLHIPLSRSSSLKLNMDSIGPRRLIDEMFNRSNRKALKSSPHPLSRRVSAVV